MVSTMLLLMMMQTVMAYTDRYYILPDDLDQWPAFAMPTFLAADRVTDEGSVLLGDNSTGEVRIGAKNMSYRSYVPAKVKTMSKADFYEEAVKDVTSAAEKEVALPNQVTLEKRKKNPPTKPVRPLDAEVNRWPHKAMINPKDVAGCGNPVCVLVDSIPRRFPSLCSFLTYLSSFERVRQFYFVQKGDCADAIELKGHDYKWGEAPKDDCVQCRSNEGCSKQVCLGIDGKATTFANVCEAMKVIHSQTSVVWMMLSMGDCAQLLSSEGYLYTEWFDLDEPCKVGDVESAAQSLAMTTTYDKTGRFRMCPKIRRHPTPEYQTVEGGDIPKDQVVDKDIPNERLICENKKQAHKPGPPNLWFSSHLRCRDYKIRHQCKCQFGCYPPLKDGSFKMDMPEISHIFEECDWRGFVSNDSPQPDTWDAEDRAGAIAAGTPNQVCGSDLYAAMFIDARRVSDDLPWSETGEFITKATPWYGFLCINKNNQWLKKTCSDYKVRYCCLKSQPAQWGKWSDWSECSKTCGGGIRVRNRVCNMKKGEKETCFGNWPAKAADGTDKFLHLKKQENKCNEIGCPEDASLTEWMPWQPCAVTCGTAKQRRRRGCDPGRHGGKECPSDRSKYEEWRECDLDKCPDPQWTKWTEWSDCSLTCGLGVKRKERKCEDIYTKKPFVPGFDCIGGGVQLTEDCKLKDCPIDGQWTNWLNWGTCSVLCGSNGKQIRRRYCAQPLPQFGGQHCPGQGEEDRPCVDVKPCPVHCQWSEWGAWSTCSISCGPPGAGTQIRGRHVAVSAAFGGRDCTGSNIENRVCPHERLNIAHMAKTVTKKEKIFYCPVDCIWGQWEPWSRCPECHGDLSGYYESDLPTYEQSRIRKVKTQARYRGKRCKRRIEIESHVGNCTTKTIPSCPQAMATEGFVGQWAEWGGCVTHSCQKAGKRTRNRDCIGNDSCKHELTETEECVKLCPPEGWSQWDQWTNCPVTCGAGQRARRRFCLDDKKEENQKGLGQSTCRGIGRQTQKCDMGPCGSKITLQYEGGAKLDPVKKYELKNPPVFTVKADTKKKKKSQKYTTKK